MHPIKLVVTDLDGTLLAPDTSISQDAVETIKELAKRNILFTFITGRPYTAITRFTEQLLVSAPIVTCNGAVICDNETIMTRHSFSLQNLELLMKSAASAGFTVLLFQDGTEYSMTETAWVRKRQSAGRSIPIKDRSAICWSTETAEKVNIIADSDSQDLDAFSKLLKDAGTHVSITRYVNTGCEIVAKGICKAGGLRELCGILEINEENVLAIGDNENDCELLSVAGVGAAVANAVLSTKMNADYVCKMPYTEGFIEAVKRFALSD